MNQVDDFIRKVNQITLDHSATYSDFFELEREYLSIIADKTIPEKEKGKIWVQSRYEVVYMICTGVRYEEDKKKEKGNKAP